MSRYWLFARFSAVAVVLGGLSWSLPVMAQDKADAPAAQEKKEEAQPDRFAVPEDATVEELTTIIKELKTFRATSREEALEYRARGIQALRTAAEKILKLEKDPKSDAYRLADSLLLQLDARTIREATPEAKADFYRRAKEYLTNSDLNAEALNLAISVAMGLEYGNARDLAAKAYPEFGEILSKSKEPEVAERAQMLVGAGRRMNLVGKPLELTGKTLKGQDFDIKNLKGKVVLVDFWATWCGPCLAEYPNILQNFEAYHDKGFEVVGVSLDADRAALEKYVDEKQVPWTTLHEKEAGGRHPAATYYGIFGIPAVILIDKEGNVVSLNARGPELGRLLAEQLGPIETKEDTKEESKDEVK
jgi:thiol-disulfide isomerase/thioredoxin